MLKANFTDYVIIHVQYYTPVHVHVLVHVHCIKLYALCMYTRRFLYEADLVLVMEGGRVVTSGHPRAVLPQVERQLETAKESVGGDKEEQEGGASNKTDARSSPLQVYTRILISGLHI